MSATPKTPGGSLLHLSCLYYIREKLSSILMELPTDAVVSRHNLQLRNYQFTKTGDASLRHPPPAASSQAHIACSVSLSNIHLVSKSVAVPPWEALQLSFPRSSMGFSHGRTYVTHAHVHTITPRHTRAGGISACLRFEAATPELPVCY